MRYTNYSEKSPNNNISLTLFSLPNAVTTVPHAFATVPDRVVCIPLLDISY